MPGPELMPQVQAEVAANRIDNVDRIVANHTLLMQLIEEIKANPAYLTYYRAVERQNLRDRLDQLAERYRVRFNLRADVAERTRTELDSLRGTLPVAPTGAPSAFPPSGPAGAPPPSGNGDSLRDVAAWIQSRRLPRIDTGDVNVDTALKVGIGLAAGVAVAAIVGAVAKRAKTAGRYILFGALGVGAALGIPYAIGKYREVRDQIDAARRVVEDARREVAEARDAINARVQQIEEQMRALGRAIDTVKLTGLLRAWDGVQRTLQSRPRNSRDPRQNLDALAAVINTPLGTLGTTEADNATRDAFLREAGLLNPPHQADVTGTPATTRYRVTYDPAAKRVAIADVSEREVLPANVDEPTQRGLLTEARGTPPDNRGLVAADVLPPGVAVDEGAVRDILSPDAGFRAFTMDQVFAAVGAPGTADVPFARAKDAEPLVRFRNNAGRQAAAYYLALTLKRIYARDVQNRIPDAAGRALTVEQMIDRRGIYLRTRFRFASAVSAPEAAQGVRDETGRSIAFALANTFNARFIAEDGQSLNVQQRLGDIRFAQGAWTSEQVQLGRAADVFMRYVSQNPDIQLSRLNPAELPSTGDAAVDTDLRAALPRFAALMRAAEVRRTLLLFANVEAVRAQVSADAEARAAGTGAAAAANVQARIEAAIDGMTLGDAAQLFLYLKDAEWEGKLPDARADAGVAGQFLLKLKIAQMVSRTDAPLARSMMQVIDRP